MYEVHPYFDHGLTLADHLANFGFLSDQIPLYAGEWGLPLTDNGPACQAVPRDLGRTENLIFETLSYFESYGISWTVAAFEPASLIRDFTSYTPTSLDRFWACGQILDPQPGMGQSLLFWLTGDLAGFGSLTPELVASAAGGPAAPVAPGEIISIYRQQLGPEPGVYGMLDGAGTLSTMAGDTQVLFDGVPAPIFFVNPYQINLQVPYSVAGQDSTLVQGFYRNVPSNPVRLQVVPAAPEIFTALGAGTALALHQSGALNSLLNPAEAGSIVVLYATGAGEMMPSSRTGKPAQAPYAVPALSVSLSIGGLPADIAYAGEAPVFVGLLQINARVPAARDSVGQASVVLTIGGRPSRPGVTIWVR